LSYRERVSIDFFLLSIGAIVSLTRAIVTIKFARCKILKNEF